MFIKLLVTKMQLVVFSPGDFAIEEDAGHEVFFRGRAPSPSSPAARRWRRHRRRVLRRNRAARAGRAAHRVDRGARLRDPRAAALRLCGVPLGLPRDAPHSRDRRAPRPGTQAAVLCEEEDVARDERRRLDPASAPAADGPAAAAAPPPRGAELLRRSSNFLSRKLSIGGAPRVQPGDEPLKPGRRRAAAARLRPGPTSRCRRHARS